ncbi:MAG: Mu transposase C-terminal domain-containing protein [Terriglobales bacterium]
MDDQGKKDIALWRLAVLGPLISARLEHGDRRALIKLAAARTQQRPDGSWVQLSARTVESWFYAYRAGGLEALMPQTRSDRGQSRAIAGPIAALVLAAKHEKPRRSIRRLIRLLERAGLVRRGQLGRSSVHRLLRAHGLSARPLRGPAQERRSFLPEHAGDLWVGDALHGPAVIAPDGRVRKAYLLSQIDGATRFMVHSYFALCENAVAHEYGFKQALLKHGLARTYYVDRGAAYWATSLRLIAAELGIHLVHTQPRDCEAKGVIERWHRTWREEVGDELPEEPLPLAELNARHWAWLGAEYHRRAHSTTGKQPLAHWLAETEHLRPLPAGKNLDEVFLHRERRVVRKDGTVRFRGALFEVRAELVGAVVELRFDAADPEAAPPRVFVEGRFVCDSVGLDRIRNLRRHRRRNRDAPGAAASLPPTGLDPLGLITDEHYRRTRLAPGIDHRTHPDDTTERNNDTPNNDNEPEKE